MGMRATVWWRAEVVSVLCCGSGCDCEKANRLGWCCPRERQPRPQSDLGREESSTRRYQNQNARHSSGSLRQPPRGREWSLRLIAQIWRASATWSSAASALPSPHQRAGRVLATATSTCCHCWSTPFLRSINRLRPPAKSPTKQTEQHSIRLLQLNSRKSCVQSIS